MSATARSRESTSFRTRWISRSPRCRTSSKTNIRFLICVARSGFSRSITPRMFFSEERSTRFRISATTCTPPAWLRLARLMTEMCCFSTPSISVSISGEICPIVAMRETTSGCTSAGSATSTLAACCGLSCPRMREIVCGCSPWIRLTSCFSSTSFSFLKAPIEASVCWILSSTSIARSGPSALCRMSRATSRPPSVR